MLDGVFLRLVLLLAVGLGTVQVQAAKKCSDYAKDLLNSHSKQDFAKAMQKVSDDIPVEEASRVFDGSFDAVTVLPDSRNALRKFIDLQIIPRARAIKGSHLRKNSVCMKNFQKLLGLAWGFQLFGVWSDAQSRKEAGKTVQDFPFDILANTAFLVWIQAEITCSTTKSSGSQVANSPKSFKEWIARAAKIDRQSVKRYLLDSAIRWRELMITVPVGLGSYIFFATSEDFLRREVELARDGESDRPSVWTPEYFKEFLNHAVFISVFESVLFARMAGFNAPLELSAFPVFQSLMKSKGLQSLGVGIEWAAYRIPMGLFDGKVLIWWKGKSGEVVQSLNLSGDTPEELIDESFKAELEEGLRGIQ